ncbi:MAG: IS630 family transposase [Ardenticatenaceae bacterium]|nr:IS630 family transposase [Ardenticatenaceae bacterium]
MKATVCAHEPVEYQLPGYGWTLKQLALWIEDDFQRCISRSALRRLVKAAGLSWKKCKQVLKKASRAKRAAYVECFERLWEQLCQEEIILISVDEAHFHRDLDLGYSWAERGQVVSRLSACASLAERINWDGAYDFTHGRGFIWNEGACNGEHTAQFLRRLVEWIGPTTRRIVLIWDGAPCHRAAIAQVTAADLGIELVPLPGYSPDLNPIEGLWKWMRQEVTQHHASPTMRALFDACKAFIDRINLDPEALISRLWPKFELDPEYEKLLVS